MLRAETRTKRTTPDKVPGRYHIQVRPAPPPPGGYPVEFHTDEGEAYVKYGKPVFKGSAQRGDPYWTAEIVSQTWFQAETGRIPISGAGFGGKFAGEGFEGTLGNDLTVTVNVLSDDASFSSSALTVTATSPSGPLTVHS